MILFLDECGGSISTSNITEIISITSPSYPRAYPRMKRCDWEIIAPKNHNIFLNFTHFDLEGTRPHFECSYDYLKIYSKFNDNRLKRIGNFCGSDLPVSISSSKNKMRVEFRSDDTIQNTGFKAEILIGRYLI